MSSTFMGLETAKRALTAQQHALQTTGHNIANANTPGFTRQRVDLQQSDAFSKAGMNQPSTPGQMGTGVDSNTVARIRDQYLDVQYRGENAKLGYWETKNENLSRMEDLMNEPTDEGVANAMDELGLKKDSTLTLTQTVDACLQEMAGESVRGRAAPPREPCSC